MSLSIGIVGLPNVGKSTLFNSLTNNKIEASNYPFCTIDPNVGVVKVPDERLDALAEMSKSAKTIHTTIEFVDIAGLVEGAHKGEGLGNKFLANIRECDAICEVVRNFEDDNIIHVDGKINPQGDTETINLELIFADLHTVQKALEKIKKEAKANKEAQKHKELLEKLEKHLSSGHSARELNLDDEDKKFLKSYNLLTLKPILYVLNIGENSKVKADDLKLDGEILELNIKLEEEISALNPEEQAEYIKELGLKESGLDKLIKKSYKLLNLITFLTTGKEESKAWTIKKGTKAPQAAGTIHSDFEKGFIRAEVINWKDLLDAGSFANAKEKGLVRAEGKDYVMADGDVCNFLFS